METKSLLAIVALLFAVFTVKSSGQDFAAARRAIAAVPPSNMNYANFCVQLLRGRYKTTCRIKTVPSVALLVCHQPVVDGKPCPFIINTELSDLKEIAKANIRTVKFDPNPIAPLKCGKDPVALTCIGFMEEWIDPKVGWMEHLGNIFRVNAAHVLIARVKKETTKTGLKTTATDLTKITDYMVNTKEKRYRQICDLQGFFLKTGGFLVGDPDGLKEKMIENERCYSDDDPTTKQVLDSLNQMIKEFLSAKRRSA